MNNSQSDMLTAKTLPCPECDAKLIIPDRIKLGTIIECAACGAESEIIDLNPFKLSPLEEEK